MSRKILTAIDLILKYMLTYLLRNTPTPTYSTYYLRPDGGASPSETSTSEVNTNSHRWPPVGPPVGQLVTAKSKKIATGTLSISGRYEPADKVYHFGVDAAMAAVRSSSLSCDSARPIPPSGSLPERNRRPTDFRPQLPHSNQGRHRTGYVTIPSIS